MWEYKKIEFTYIVNSDLIDRLNSEGKNNWEIIWYVEEDREKFGKPINVKALFKRLNITNYEKQT